MSNYYLNSNCLILSLSENLKFAELCCSYKVNTSCILFKLKALQAFQWTESLHFLNKAFIVKHYHERVVENL